MENNNNSKKHELIYSIGLLVISLLMIFWIIPSQTVVSKTETSMQPAAFPTVASVLVLAGSILLIIQLLLGKLKPEHQGENGLHVKAFIKIIATVIVYLLMIKYVGFYTSTLIACVLALHFYAKVNWVACIVGTVIFLGVVYALFEIALAIPLPKGFLL